jgi:hypothetical protein
VSAITRDLRGVVAQAPGRLDPVQAGHAQVHEDDVGRQLHGEGRRLVAVGGGADDLHPGQQAEQHHQAFAHHPLVVGDQDADPPAHAGIHSSTW